MKYLRQYIKLILEDFAADIQTAKSSREAKQIFAKYVKQDYFKQGTIIHWTGTTKKLDKMLSDIRPKDEISANYYEPSLKSNWKAATAKYSIGVEVKGYVTYAGNENLFSGEVGKRPRGKKKRAAWEHQKASSGTPRRPYDLFRTMDFLYDERIKDPKAIRTGQPEKTMDYRYDVEIDAFRDMEVEKIPSMQPRAIAELGDDAWMGASFGLKSHQYWNEVIIDNWKPVSVVIGRGVKRAMARKVRAIAMKHGLPVKEWNIY